MNLTDVATSGKFVCSMGDGDSMMLKRYQDRLKGNGVDNASIRGTCIMFDDIHLGTSRKPSSPVAMHLCIENGLKTIRASLSLPSPPLPPPSASTPSLKSSR